MFKNEKSSIYCTYSDGTPDYDGSVDYANTYIAGAHGENLWPLSHADLRQHSVAMEAMLSSLLGEVGNNP